MLLLTRSRRTLLGIAGVAILVFGVFALLSRIRSGWGVSCISEVVWEFARVEGFECASDPIIECGNRPFLGLAQMRLDFGKALLDRIEIGTVGRQVAQCSV